ncbi:MAG: dehydrogenase [Actinobacteria bacterium]|jgi:Predicted dehydrogenase|nr:dehydrogenase [Actinomycetota bacterium]
MSPRTRRPAKRRLTVVNITLQSEEWDYDEEVSLGGQDYRLIRIGTRGDIDRAEELVWQWSLKCDAIAVTGAREAKARGLFSGNPADIRQVRDTTTRVPVRDGSMLADVLQEWAIRRVQADLPGYFSNARVVVVGSATQERTITVLREFTANVDFEDPDKRTGVPLSLGMNPVASRAAGLGMFAWDMAPELLKSVAHSPAEWVSGRLAHQAAGFADVLVGSYADLTRFGLPDLTGKAVLTNAVSEERLATLAAKGVSLVIDATPEPFDFMVVTAMFEAMAAATITDGHTLSTDDLVTFLETSGLAPRMLWPNGVKRRNRFAFVIHPLSTEYFKKVEALGLLSELPGMGRVVEKTAAHMPPFVYSHVTGITSPDGTEAEGWLISVGGTPKEMLSHPPEFTYSRLLEAADLAKRLGAQIMGLGAFTKVVGDAGVTVSKRASLPVTTGNSYSASGALWAAHAAIRRLGIGEVDEDGRFRGKAMVVGGSGAIGAACARLLALATDEVWLVSPETAKLLTLKAEIEAEDPRATIHVATDPGEALADMDLIVTATSAAGTKVLDIMKVKPGCVITDVARPLDMSAEDVAKRPDVLVIESGEVELPGDVRMRNIGLPDGVAYACLAETIVLALEGRFEAFTVGRNIEWRKVKEIYQLGLKHGMELATISGINGPFTDEDFARVRELALAARAELEQGEQS